MEHASEVTIVNKYGLHARPAAEFVKLANRFASEVFIRKDDVEVSGKSIMGVMMLAAECGSTVHIRADGDDARGGGGRAGGAHPQPLRRGVAPVSLVRDGIPAAPGIVIAPARVLRWEVPRVPHGRHHPPGPGGRRRSQRFRDACALRAGAHPRGAGAHGRGTVGEVEARIFEPQVLMLEDADLVQGTIGLHPREPPDGGARLRAGGCWSGSRPCPTARTP